MQPGDTITPGTDQRSNQQQPVQNTAALLPVPPQEASPQATTPLPLSPEVLVYNTPQQPQFPVQPVEEQYFTQDDQPARANFDTPQAVSWSASEFIAHSKSSSWYMLLGLGMVVVTALVFLMTRDVFATVVVAAAGIAFAVVAARKPRVLQYAIDENGVQVGDKHNAYHEFRSFTHNVDGPLPSLLFYSVKRFVPPLTVYYDPQQEEVILDTLSLYLPHEDRQPDVVDRLMGRIRF